MSHRRTASKLEMAKSCPPSHTLAWITDEGTVYSAKGDGIHAAIEQVPVLGLEVAVAKLPEDWKRVARALAETPFVAPLLEPGAAALELAMEWHPETGVARALGRGRGSYALATAGAITGTADLVAVTHDRVIVGDWKTGAKVVPHPLKNLQLRFLALAAARAFNRDQATAFIGYARDDEDAVVVSADFDCLDLEGIAEELRAIESAIAAVDHGDAEIYKRGEWCTYCPAKQASCPAWIGLVRWVTKDVPGLQAQVGQAISMGAIVAAWEMVQNAKKAAGVLEAEIRRLAYGTPLPLGNGKYLAYAAGNERVVDAELVHSTLVRVAGPEVAEKAVTSTVVTESTKKLIEKALAALPVKDREPAWAELRKVGALKRKADVREVDDAADILAPPPMEARAT